MSTLTLDRETITICQQLARRFPKGAEVHIVARPLGDVFVTDRITMVILPADSRDAVVLRSTFGTDDGTGVIVILRRTTGPTIVSTDGAASPKLCEGVVNPSRAILAHVQVRPELAYRDETLGDVVNVYSVAYGRGVNIVRDRLAAIGGFEAGNVVMADMTERGLLVQVRNAAGTVLGAAMGVKA